MRFLHCSDLHLGRRLCELDLLEDQKYILDQLLDIAASEGVDAPVIALIAHMDTAPDASGENVKPRLVRYEGGELKLNDSVSLTEALCPGLESHMGDELVVTDGTTLLGADDKAGLAEIMAAVETILEKNIKHGEVRIIFTTDEEIGHGTDGLDVQELGCDYGYTVDGGPLGEIEYENFNAAAAVLTVHGVGVHPGSAKNVMVNAATVAMDFHALLPEDEVPEKTEGYEGFFHLTDMEGGMAKATLRYIIRDHDREKFEEKKALFAACRQGDPAAQAILDRWLEDLAQGLASLVHCYNPDVLLLGGGVSAQGEYLSEQVCLKLQRKVMPSFMAGLAVKTAALGNQAGMLGAAYSLLSRINQWMM